MPLTYKEIIDHLPKLYASFLPNIFFQQIPEEILATCDDCARCKKPGQPDLPEVYCFLANAMCCSYHPSLPNYLIGGLLDDKRFSLEQGRQIIRKKIAGRIGVTPHGIFPSPKYVLLYRSSRQTSFGRNESLLCPYHSKNTRRCTIYEFRDSVCSAYYCHHVAGFDGKLFWNSLRDYLVDVEDKLSKFVLFTMNWNPQVILKRSFHEVLDRHTPLSLHPEDLDDLPPPKEEYEEFWGEWSGREEEFYIEAFNRVSNLNQKALEQITGISQQILLEQLKGAHQRMMNPQLPNVLKKNPSLETYKLKDGSYLFYVRIGDIKNFYQISNQFHDVLHIFDGHHSNEEVRRLISREKGVELTRELLVSLYQNRILIK